MNQLKKRINTMINKFLKINFKSFKNTLTKSVSYFNKGCSKGGIIYTLYSDKHNLLEVGFAENRNILDSRINQEKFILLDQKKGSFNELKLLKETLKQLGVSIFNNNYFMYKSSSLRYLNTLGWPIGNSLYKQRIIKKKISYSIS